MSSISHMGETFYPISLILTKFLKPDGDCLIHIPSLVGSLTLANPNIGYLKEQDYLNYQQKLNDVLFEQKILTKDSALVLGGILDNIFAHIDERSISSFMQHLPLMLELSSNSEYKKLFSQSLTNPNAKISFVRSIISHNLAIKLKHTSTYFLSRLLAASYFCDFTTNDDPVFHGIVNSIKLESIPEITSDVVLAIKHHHEFNDGSGPLGVKNFNIHPLAKIVRLADELSLLGGKTPAEFKEKINSLQFKVDAPLLLLVKK